jgi:SNF2 family DNA or RNA helicase
MQSKMRNFRESKFYDIFQKLTQRSGMQEKEYQLEGISWAIRNESGVLPYDIRGGIIADEMGLGKTFQIISTLACNFKPKTLIVLPPILIQQWVDAFIKITGHKPFVYHSKFTNISSISFEKLNTSPIVITTYGMTTTTTKKRNILHTIQWDRVIFDEAHHLRNKNTSVFKGALLINSKIKWFITGTPIQNKLNDLYRLCDLLGIPEHIYHETGNHAYLKEKFMLRRTKKQVDIHIPPAIINHILIHAKNRIETAIADELHSILPFYIKEKNDISTDEDDDEGEDISENEENKVNEIVISHITNESDDADLYLPESKVFTRIYGAQDNILPVFMRARQMCIFPPMFQKILDKNIDLIDSPLDLDLYTKTLLYANKLDTLIKFISERKDNEHKKIVFCFFKNEIDYIYQRLNIININTKYIDGRTTHKKKNDILSNQPDVLILQIQTSCEGLNLQEYSEVYFTSPHWNPAVESQAIARCHRIGQTKPVQVFKLININPVKSIEQYIIGIQNNKKNIARLIGG